jgi:hypothetical protein
MLVLGVPTLSSAALLEYSFTGLPYDFDGNERPALEGGFTLDPFGTWQISPVNGGNYATLASSAHEIWGTYGEYSFLGSVTLYIADQPEYWNGTDVVVPDHWIPRATVSSNQVNGLSIVAINLFSYIAAAADTLSLIPPHSPNLYDFSYAVAFSDGTFTTAPLARMHPVPEPETLALFAIGLVGAAIAARRRRLSAVARALSGDR